MRNRLFKLILSTTLLFSLSTYLIASEKSDHPLIEKSPASLPNLKTQKFSTHSNKKGLIDHSLMFKLEYLSIDSSALSPILAHHFRDDEKLYLHLQEMLLKSKIELFESIYVRANHSGSFSSGENFFYPVEGGIPQLASGIFSEADMADLGKSNKALAVGPIPTAYRERALGIKGSFSLKLTGTKSCRLQLKVTHTQQSKWNVFKQWTDHFGTMDKKMPQFHIMSFASNTLLPMGKPVLITTLTPAPEKDQKQIRKIVVFVKVWKVD